MNYKVVAIIPARYKSSRFVGKPLAEIVDKPMIMHVFDNVSKSKLVNEVIVATDDKRIFDEVKKNLGKAVFTSENHKNGTERIAEVAAKFDNDTIIINVQGDEPLINTNAIEQIISVFNDKSVEIATLVNKKTTLLNIENRNVVKAVFDKNYNALYFSRNSIQSSCNEYFTHIGIYAFKNSVLQKLVNLPESNLEKAESLEQLRWLENGFKVKVAVTEYESIAVDLPEDIEKVLKVLNL